MTVTTSNDSPIKYYTLAEVAQNTGKAGKPLWIVYKNSVYDVTEYVASGVHPGDPNLITDFAGKDCTRDFNDAGHSPDAMREMKQMKIGEIAEEDRKGGAKKAMSVQSMVSVGEDGEKKRRRRFLLCR
jgi:cytochrome b involved in lipid metabolism